MHLELMRDKDRAFPDVNDPLSISSIRVWYCKYETLKPIARLSTLRGADLAGLPDSSLDWLTPLTALEYLSILHMPKIDDLQPLSALEALRTIRLSTLPSWDSSGRRTRVASLAPLAPLQRLHHVELLGVVPVDNDLSPLLGLPNLKTVRLHGFARQIVRRFFEQTPAQNAFAPPASF